MEKARSSMSCSLSLTANGLRAVDAIKSRLMAQSKHQMTSSTVAVIFGYIRKMQPVKSSEPFRKGN